MLSTRRYIALIGSALVLGFFLYTFSTIVGYVLIAWVLSMIGQPLMRWLQAKLQFGQFKAGSGLCAAITLITIFAFFAALIALFVPMIVTQAGNIANVEFSSVATALEQPYQSLQSFLAKYGMTTRDRSLEEVLNESLSGLFKIEDIGSLFTGALSVSGSILIGLFSVVFITFFFLREQGLFTNFLISAVPDTYSDQTQRAIEEITFLLSRYFNGILLQVTIITIYVSVWLRILSIENALLIAFFAGLINVIPYLGPLIGATFGAFIVIASNLEMDFYTEMLPLIIKVLVVFSSMQLIDNFILQPFIFSNSVLAHPLEIFIIILMGAQLGGIPGMVLAIPAYTVIRVVAKVFFQRFSVVRKLTQAMEEKEAAIKRQERKEFPSPGRKPEAENKKRPDV